MSMDSLCNISSSTSWPSQKYVKWVVMAHFVTVDYVESQSECTAGSVANRQPKVPMKLSSQCPCADNPQ